VGSFLKEACVIILDDDSNQFGPLLQRCCARPDRGEDLLFQLTKWEMEDEARREDDRNLVLSVLKCCSENSISPFVVNVQKKGQIQFGGVFNVPNSWALSVGTCGDAIFVEHERVQSSPQGATATFSFTWHVVFMFSRSDGTLKSVSPYLSALIGDAEVGRQIVNLFDDMRSRV